MGDGTIDRESFGQFLKERFSYEQCKPDDPRIIECLIDLVSKHQKNSVAAFLLDCAMLISKKFEFKEVCIGLKDRADGLYKYGVIVGALPASQEALKKITYTYEDMISDEKYPGFKIGRFSKYCMTESAETEQKTFNRPALVGKPRQSLDDFIEGDYIDTFMYGGGDELIGWVEVASPKSGKIPDKEKLLWLELVVAIISRIVWERMYRREFIM
ncbi:MAG: hypothetical protein QXE18_04985 [Thermoplasmata archaeon]